MSVYHRVCDHVYLQVEVSARPKLHPGYNCVYLFTCHCSLFPDQLWALGASLCFSGASLSLRAFLCIQ